MPHYADGTEAKVGDIVRGKGHTTPHEIQGRVVAIMPSETCNMSVAHVGKFSPTLRYVTLENHEPCSGNPRVEATIEICNCNAFTKIA